MTQENLLSSRGYGRQSLFISVRFADSEQSANRRSKFVYTFLDNTPWQQPNAREQR